MICNGCSIATNVKGDKKHGVEACDYPLSCTCQHGRYLEQDPEDETVPAYLDQLPKDDPRRIAYEERVGRKML